MTVSTEDDSGETIVIQIFIARMLVMVKTIISWDRTLIRAC